MIKSIYITEIPSTTKKPTYKECNMEHPYESHPTNCHLFYQCTPGLNGNEFVEKSCGENMFYNPQIQVCDWPANVISVRPECSMKQTMPNTTEWTTDNTTKYTSITSTTLQKNITASIIYFLIVFKYFINIFGTIKRAEICKKQILLQKHVKKARHGANALLTVTRFVITINTP